MAHDGRSAEVALAPFESHLDRSAVRAIALGSMRWYLRLAPAVDKLLERPKSLRPDVRALLVAGAHQIEYSRNPPESTVHVAVDAARALRQERSASLVNAVLRRFVSQRESLLARTDADLAARTAHPAWLAAALEEAWPQHFESILEANNKHPPMVLRVDLSRQSVADYLALLADAGLAGHTMPWAPAAIRLESPVPPSTVPGLREGLVSVQDAGAQLAAPLLDARPGMRVLDACAAPGGKTGHLLEHTPGLDELVAIDIEPSRVARIRENLERLRRDATLLVADVRDPASFWDGRPFERILVDAPCSSTGVIRRHPDIKLLRRPSDITALSRAQLEILRACFTMLAPGGRLVYSSCSVLPAENEAVVARFLESEPLARVASLPRGDTLAPGAVDRKIGIQLVPGADAETDGFYYACLEKATVGV